MYEEVKPEDAVITDENLLSLTFKAEDHVHASGSVGIFTNGA